MALSDLVVKAHHWLTAPAGANRPIETKQSRARIADSFYHLGVEQYPPRKYRDLLRLYCSNPILRRSTKLAAESLAAIEPIIEVGGQQENLAAQQIAEILKRPNPTQDRFSFIRDLASFDKLSGNGWVEMVPGMGAYVEHYALRPERMRIKPGANGFVEQYIYDPQGGARVKYWNDEGVGVDESGRILHIKDFNPADDYYGAGALEAAEGALGLYESAQTLARNLFDRGALMSGILSYAPNVPSGAAAPQLTEEQRAGLQKILDQFKIGGKRAGGIMMAPASLNYQPMTHRLVDLQAEEIRNEASRQIANAFGVPPMLLGIPGDNTFANFREATRAMFRMTIIPDATRVFGGLAAFHSKIFRDRGLEQVEYKVDVDKMWALADEVAELWARVDNAQGLSINERREAKGWEKLEHPMADVVLVSAGLIPLDQIINPIGAQIGYEPDPTQDGDQDGNLNE